MKWAATLLLSCSIAFPAAAQQRRHAASPAAPPCAEAVLAEPFLTADLALDGQFLYFADDNGGLFRVARNGGIEATKLTQVSDGLIISIVVDQDRVYFATANDSTFLSTVYSVPKSGGASTILASGVVTPFDLAADDQFLYWNSVGTPTGEQDFLSDGKIERIRKDGSGRATLASSLSYPLALALDGDNVLFGETGLAVGNPSAGLRSVPKNGGAITNILDGVPVLSITADATRYFLGYVEAEAFAGSVASVAKDTKTLTKLSSDNGLPLFIKIFGNDLYYFFLSDSDSIRAVPLSGGAVRIVKAGDFYTQEFVVDACAVFYGAVDFDTLRGSVRRSPR